MTDDPGKNRPPALTTTVSGEVESGSAADVVEWFLAYDERVARMRHPMTNDLFHWKQADDAENGLATYPFNDAESRFAVGVVQALAVNNSEPTLKHWIGDVLAALESARETRSEINSGYSLDADAEMSAIDRSRLLPTASERRIYLTACWLEVLCTAEARVLGWVYQELYGRAFSAA